MRVRSFGFRPATACPVFVEACKHLGVARDRGGRGVHHNDVQSGQQVLPLAKRLSYDSLYTVSCVCAAAILFRDGQAQPGGRVVIWPAKHGKQIVAAPGCLVEYAAESGSIEKPVCFLEPVARAARQSWGGARRRDGRRRLTASAWRGPWRGGA